MSIIRRVLVTGGAGFIGSNLARFLQDKGITVRVLDNLSSGHSINLRDLDVELVRGDVRDPETVCAACAGMDAVFHLAACVGRQKSLESPLLDSSTNLLGTINILEGMRKHQVHRMVYSSSAAIFGELKTPLIDENHAQNADSPYGVSKLAAEKMILAYGALYDMTCIGLRYFNIYGRNQRFDQYGNVIPIFAKRIFAAETLTIYGDGEQTRDFLNVADVVEANYRACLADIQTDVFNIGSGSSITINELARKMLELSPNKPGTVHAPERPADVRHCKADISKAKAVLGFSPQVDLDSGLADYMAWFAQYGQ